MISNLRKRIVAINVVVAGFVLLVAILMIFMVGYSRINSERDNRLKFALEYDPRTAEIPFEENTIFEDVALVWYNVASGKVERWFFGSNFGIDKEYLEAHLADIVKTKAEKGFVSGYVRYVKSTEGLVVRISFNNFVSRNNSLVPYFISALASLFIGVSCYLFISIFLAKIAIKPAEDSWKKQRQFVADASHELKTPLSVIMANIDIMAAHPDETVQSQMQWLENSKAEAQRMAGLVADLLFLAKNDDGVQVELSDTNLSEAVGEIVLSHDAIFYENGKEFSYDIQSDLYVEGNDGQLKQLVTILLDNANKYSEGSGNIHLSLWCNARHAVLSVSNNCVAISDDQLQHLFDRFYTTDPSRNKSNGGNGLGLSIAKTICETHRGSIFASYENGRITLTATLPLQKGSKRKQTAN